MASQAWFREDKCKYNTAYINPEYRGSHTGLSRFAN